MNGKNNIPFLDLITPHNELEEELVSIFRAALRRAAFIGGPVVEEFERQFSQFCGTRYCVGVASGTDAVRFALIAAGVKPGDLVITAPNTFIATTEAISQAGAFPGFVDIDPLTYNISPERLREYLETQCVVDDRTGRPLHLRTNRRVAAVVPVHLFGQPACMDQLLEIARKYGLVVIEDACQAHGAEYSPADDISSMRVGSLGLAGAFSFYPGKNLGACGEAGAVTTNDEQIAQTIRMLRDHGQLQKYYHEMEGYNGRLDAIQAGILLVKLSRLPKWNDDRRARARNYDAALRGLAPELITPVEPKWAKSVYHLYVVRNKHRELLQNHLAARGICTGIHYPIPLHLQVAYRHLGLGKGYFPEAERAADEILSLPMYPQLGVEEQERVVEAIYAFVEAGAGVTA